MTAGTVWLTFPTADASTAVAERAAGSDSSRCAWDECVPSVRGPRKYTSGSAGAAYPPLSLARRLRAAAAAHGGGAAPPSG